MADEITEPMREWRIEVRKNPPDARFKWTADLCCGSNHFREVEHNTRKQAVLLATQVLGKYILTEEQQPEEIRAPIELTDDELDE